MLRLRWLFPALLLVVTTTTEAQAQGGTPEAEARDYYKTGIGHFDAGRYLQAQAAFAAGFELSHKPGFLWNMAESARLLKDPTRALALYRQFLHDAPATSPQRPDAERWVKELEPQAPSPATTTAAPPSPPPPPLAPRATPPTGPSALLSPSPKDPPPSTPVYKRWWFWAGAGAVVTAATAIAVVAATSGAAPPGSGLPSADQTIDWRSK